MPNPPVRKPSKTRQKRFLAAYRECGVIRRAAQVAGINHKNHYAWMKNPEYAKSFKEADEDAVDALEYIARQRALEKSDTLLIFLLRAKCPEKYGRASTVYIDKRVEHSGTVGLQQVAPDHEAESIDQFPLELRRQMLAFLRQRNTGKKSKAS